MNPSKPIAPLSLNNSPALIEKLLPAQRLSSESYKEQEARQSKTLTALGSYWKGRKPLILNKACILGCLLPATDNPDKDLEIFEMLMGMDEQSFKKRLKLKPEEHLPAKPYRELVEAAERPEKIYDTIHAHIWPKVNAHLGTSANSFPELVEQIGIMRFGHRPKVADTFCGSGQIPFEAARLGCDVYASDLNPVACMLTWGAFHIVGSSSTDRDQLKVKQNKLIEQLQSEIDRLGIETDGRGWRAKAFLYCVEAKCPQTGWTVPLLASLIISKQYNVIAELLPDASNKRYNIEIRSYVSSSEMAAAAKGTIRTDKRGEDSYMVHTVDGIEYHTKISTLRSYYCKDNGSNGNSLRLWEKTDLIPREGDLFQERLYAVQWMRLKAEGKGEEYEFRSITDEDLYRERIVQDYIIEHFFEWQEKGWIPSMRIEKGDKTDEPIRTRGWTYWHHLFNPRQLLLGGLINRFSSASEKFAFTQAININSRLSRWNSLSGVGQTAGTFDNQALNPLFNYGCRGLFFLTKTLQQTYTSYPLPTSIKCQVECLPADQSTSLADIFITDPPYGDAVKYEEILEFFISWLCKNPPFEFANWIWDSRRALAIKGEDEDFRYSMVSAYKRITECMPDNGIQVIMFTHQDGTIWSDMANIVWASGLQVTAAWYVVTETESSLRNGRHVKGTVLLVVRKRLGRLCTTRDDLAWDIKDELEVQIATLTGLNQQVKSRYRDENLFDDADIQMAGYAAALRVLTQYAVIDGKEMASEAIRPRVNGQKTFVDELIEFSVDLANRSLVPQGIKKTHWEKLKPAERFYLKLLELESRGCNTLDNYQNFAKAFKLASFKPLMASEKANSSRLKSAVELGNSEMGDSSQIGNTPLRAILYAIMELTKGVDGSDVLAHISFNVEGFYDPSVRELMVDLTEYLASKLIEMRPEEASAARILRELIKNQKM